MTKETQAPQESWRRSGVLDCLPQEGLSQFFNIESDLKRLQGLWMWIRRQIPPPGWVCVAASIGKNQDHKSLSNTWAQGRLP